MKIFRKITLFIVYCLFQTLVSQAQDQVYKLAIQKNIVMLDSAQTVQDMQKVCNQFERISEKYPDSWIPLYYIAYSDIKMVLYNPQNSTNNSILDDAHKKLSKLNKMNNIDLSEICTLWGYYYNAMIMMDPATNGQKYYNEVLSNYNKAIKLNKNNPRPLFLLAFFDSNLPSFLQSEKDYCGQYSRAAELYNSESESIEKPFWGKKFLEMLLANCK